ncbi:MAG: hypothetical protein HY231_02040 [Acidobacteria bacterium]|nr:hypothetical protein [Acidobacteriota bacterium]
MQNKLKKNFMLLMAAVMLLLAANLTQAQADNTAKKRLYSPATAKGFIGGESHDSYQIHARKGQTMTVRISWRRKDNNRAEFTVSESPNFFGSAPVTFGKASDHDKGWRGKIPKTGNYYLYVVAHPTAHYTLWVTVK